jgi:gamma-glutamylcyclotransferase (GGCT)/AIG2-like uncharacterized protein YtfP
MLVFVYGTLKRGYANHRVMLRADGKYLGEAVVSGYACINTPWYPYAIKQANAKIKGEVFELENENIVHLDTLEGYPSHYDRDIIKTKYGDCWIYYSKDDFSKEIIKYGLVEEWK